MKMFLWLAKIHNSWNFERPRSRISHMSTKHFPWRIRKCSRNRNSKMPIPWFTTCTTKILEIIKITHIIFQHFLMKIMKIGSVPHEIARKHTKEPSGWKRDARFSFPITTIQSAVKCSLHKGTSSFCYIPESRLLFFFLKRLQVAVFDVTFQLLPQ